ncbi:hypothetical protein RND81_09G184900 [Saponaria officinalis]|uniref:Transmembrane protein n=1 Tax=Saponaria officinalis TaxID=3572 RepID=A0AAW1IPA3_SAPOF
MKQEKLTKFIKIIKVLKKLNFSYILSIFFFFISLLFIILYTMISSSYLFDSTVSDMKLNISRIHMFLLCNGILIILVRSSSSRNLNFDDQISGNLVDYENQRVVKRVSEISISEQTKVVGFEENNAALTAKIVVHEFEYGDHDNRDCENENGDRNDDDDEEDEDADADAEELNRRCEEFIRRMKLGIISESKYDHGFAGFS